MSDTKRAIPQWIKRDFLLPLDEWQFWRNPDQSERKLAMYKKGADGVIRNVAKCGFSAGGRLSWCDDTEGMKSKRYAKRRASKYYRRAGKRDAVNQLSDIE